MKKYYIIPKASWKEAVEANSAGEAIEKFATTMDMDMNIYFDVVNGEDYELEERRLQFMDFGIDVLYSDFCLNGYNEEEAEELIDAAWDLYCGNAKGGEGLTQYECIEKIVNRYETEHDARHWEDYS